MIHAYDKYHVRLMIVFTTAFTFVPLYLNHKKDERDSKGTAHERNKSNHEKEGKNSMNTQARIFVFYLQIAAIIVISCGSGWAGGNFSQGLPLWNVLLHALPLVLLVIFSWPIVRAQSTANWGGVAITILVIIGLIAVIALIVLGATNPDPNSVGVHNLWDWFAAILELIGNGAWLVLLIPARLAHIAHRAEATGNAV
jgi:cation transport ATPase